MISKDLRPIKIVLLLYVPICRANIFLFLYLHIYLYIAIFFNGLLFVVDVIHFITYLYIERRPQFILHHISECYPLSVYYIVVILYLIVNKSKK